MLRIPQLKLDLSAGEAELWQAAAKALRLPKQQIQQLKIVKRSVDARKKERVQLVYTVDVALCCSEAQVLQRLKKTQIGPSPKAQYRLPLVAAPAEALRPVVVGLGPAGFLAALVLAEAGCPPLVIERGQRVEERQRAVARFWQGGPLDVESNVQFGEGGAGTFSDGKLTTNTKDIRNQKVLAELVEAGAPAEILYQAKPHIGTDLLRQVVQHLRQKILRLGGEICFGTKLVELHWEKAGGKKQLAAMTVQGPQGRRQLAAEQLILAIGHSARDTMTWLHEAGLPMAPKPFSLGVRVEHLQRELDQWQYGAFAGHPALGAADYKLACHLPNGRSVYTFCMCPGGQVVAAASEAGGIVTNGMSHWRRDGENANSAVLVGVGPADFGDDHPLAGMWLQRRIEQAAFRLAGETYLAPCQRLGDFLQNRPSQQFGKVLPSYLPGVTLGQVGSCLPDFVVESLRQGFLALEQKLPGFAQADALLTGPETRSSSPVRLLRDETYQSWPGLYPCGEGAGYAGGIVSAAADGIRCAEAVLQQLAGH